MAKIQSPSGETEFFQTTELQQAFEKELKTGEKVTIAPGVKEASFFREAPVRAEFTEAFQEFKDRLINPYVPPTPPVQRCICLLVLRQWGFNYYIPSSYYFNNVGPNVTPTLPQEWYGVISETKSDIYPNLVNNLDFYNSQQGVRTADDPTNGRTYGFNQPSPPLQGRVLSGCTESEILIPDFLTMTGFVGYSNKDLPNDSNGWYGQNGDSIFIDGGVISFQYVLKTGGLFTQSYTFNANIPSSDTWTRPEATPTALPIWTLQADIRKYAGKCLWPEFENFRFTNLYP
jgi:hypothetical protein